MTWRSIFSQFRYFYKVNINGKGNIYINNKLSVIISAIYVLESHGIRSAEPEILYSILGHIIDNGQLILSTMHVCLLNKTVILYNVCYDKYRVSL
jgi:hypothetical protein